MATEISAIVNLHELRTYGWAIVELMGRNVIAGRVDEIKLGANVGFRVISPVGEGEEWITDLASQAVYAITPCTEEVARQVASQYKPPMWMEFVERPRYHSERMERARAEAQAVKQDLEEAMRDFPPDDLPF